MTASSTSAPAEEQRDATDFGALRALLNRPPTRTRWDRLCALLERAWETNQRRTRDEWLPYVNAHLKSWPDDWRKCPGGWLDLRDPTQPLLSITRALSLSSTTGSHRERLEALMSTPCWPHVKSLALPGQLLDDSTLELFLESPPPSLAHLDLRDHRLSPKAIRKLLMSDAGQALTSLDLSHHAPRQATDALCDALLDAMPPLVELKLRRLDLAPERLGALLEFSPRLAHIDLSESSIGPAGIENLGDARAPESLTRLTLQQDQLDRHAMTSLARCRLMQQIEHLDLEFNMLGVSALALLLQHAYPRLKKLNLSLNGLRDRDIAPLVRAEGICTLSHLDLSGNWIGAQGTRALAHTPNLAALEQLHLNSNDLGPLGAHELARTTTLRNLEVLSLGLNHLTPEGARALARGHLSRQLRELKLERNDLRDAGVKELVHGEILSHLQKLNLQGNDLTRRAAALFSSCEDALSLEHLNLSFNPHIGTSGALRLVNAPGLTRLERLDLHVCGVDADVIRQVNIAPHLELFIRA